MERDEALTLLRLSGAPGPEQVETAFLERQYEIEQKLISAAPEEGARVTLNFELERIEEASLVLNGAPLGEHSAPPIAPAGVTPGDTPSPAPDDGVPGGIGVNTVQLALPPGASPLGDSGGGGILGAIGGWTIRLLALAAVLAGIFVYLTQFGPLTGWWKELVRDKDRAGYARTLRAESEELAERWTLEAGLLRVEEPAEIRQAREAVRRGEDFYADCRDEHAITAWLDAKNRFEVGLGELTRTREQVAAQGAATGESIGHLFTEIEKAEWSFDRRERDASEEVHRAEENLKSARSGEDRKQFDSELREARSRLALARELQNACRRIVFESDRLPRIQDEVGKAILGLREPDVHAATAKLDALKVEIEALLVLSEDLERTVRELWACEQVLAAAKSRVEPGDREFFAPAGKALASLRESLSARKLEEVRGALPAVRATVSGTERLLPVRGEAPAHAARLTATRHFPELDAKREAAMETHRAGDEDLLAGERAEAEKAYREAKSRLSALEAELKNALYARAKEVAKEDVKAARTVLEDLLRLDPLDVDAIALKKELSDRRETVGIIVPDTAKTLADALRRAKPGETIRIRPGVYAGGVIFKEGVRIEGAGADRVTIRCGARDANVITVKNCRSGSISGVTLEHVGTDMDEHRFSCLHVEKSTIQVKNVTLRNAAGSGVLLTDGGRTTVSNCLIEGSGWFGICYTDGSGGTASGNECRRNGFSGIAVISKAREVDVTGNQCRSNGLHGIYFGGGTSGRAIGNTAEHNRGSGIAVRGPSADPTVSGNRCRDNRQFGIYLDGKAGGTLENNVCSENDYSGIGAVGTAPGLFLRKNTCVGNRRDGIYLFDQARGVVEENRCERNEDSGIAAIGTHSALVLRRNRCISNRTWGIYFGGGAGGTAEGNTCERNTRDGIAATEAGTAPVVVNNRCVSNRGDGIHFAKGTGGTVDGNTCEKNKGYGLYADRGSSARIAKTTAEGNGVGGLGGKARE